MANVPKKVVDRFLRAVPKFQKVLQIAKDRDVNESDTVSVLNDILAEVFGYDKYLEVTSEFMVRGTYCDLAIKVGDKVQFLIEAKAIGIDLKEAHIKQAVDYGANHGVQWVILTNGIAWRVYRIQFEQPINHDLVCCFDFPTINPRSEKDQDLLFALSKEGLDKSAREQFYDKVQSINRYVISSLILNEPVLTVIRRELKKLSDGVRIEPDDIASLVRTEILKREVVEGEQAEAAQARVAKFYRRGGIRRHLDKAQGAPSTPAETKSLTERPAREPGDQGTAGRMS